MTNSEKTELDETVKTDATKSEAAAPEKPEGDLSDEALSGVAGGISASTQPNCAAGCPPPGA